MSNWTQTLINWYRQNARELPFRVNRDPYRIWISEIMAQQTRIEAMLEHYERFMDLYPTLKELSQACDEELMKAWQGLGYYSRARNLKKAAIQCMELYDGKLPCEVKDLTKLAGIGDYTAGAIASIAYQKRVPAIDGNVLRVISRREGIRQDVREKTTFNYIRELVIESLPQAEDCGDYNQALMELGALICIPKNPRCTDCPVESFCQAKILGVQNEIPLKVKKAKRTIEQKNVVMIACYFEGQWWVGVHQRPSTGLLANLYEFDYELPGEELQISSFSLEEYVHVFTHKEWHLKPYLVIVAHPMEHFVPIERLENELPLPSAYLPIYEQARRILDEETNKDGCE